MSVALVTGGSRGLGRALVLALAARGWTVVTDGRDGVALAQLELAEPGERPGHSGRVVTVAGDITDADHRAELHATLEKLGGLDLLVHNASSLGPTPLPRLEELTIEDLTSVWRPNIGAPLVLTALLLPLLVASRGTLVGITSDAAVEHYPGWGLYGASKAALEHLVLQYAAENPAITAYAVDPGDMRTQMHQDAFPGEDISDRPPPESVVPHLLALLDARPASGRHRAADFDAAAFDAAGFDAADFDPVGEASGTGEPVERGAVA
jgi:NAD(P)-dependent dehydrogenase (short-subunit alcohol dehydrogenase family)